MFGDDVFGTGCTLFFFTLSSKLHFTPLSNIYPVSSCPQQKEFAVPEQFRTNYDGKKLHTECAEVVG